MRFNNTIYYSAMFLVSILLSACGGGGGGNGSSNPPASTLSGVAAVGFPIVTGTINVICAAGSALAPSTTSSTGTWQVTLSGQTLPCAVQVNGGTINGAANNTPYHSIAIVAGTVNITPLTDLMVANLAGTATPNIWFAGLSATPAPLTAITQTQVDAALIKLSTALSELTELSTVNPITMAFTPTSGNVSDNMLTALKTAMTNTGVTYASLLSNASATAFTAPVSGFGTALTTAYTGTTSGATTGGTTSSNPGISGVIPSSAAPGAAVTILGTNFAAGANILSGSNYQVSFNGTTATPSARTLTQLAVIVPTGATTGTLTVTDLTTNLVYTVPGGFTVIGTTGSGTGTTIAAVGTQMGGARQGSPLILSTSVSLFAGNLFYGSSDGIGSAASFSGSIGIATDGSSLFIADTSNNLIRKVALSTATVTTIAGGGSGYNQACCSLDYAKPGALEGTGSATSFSSPKWITTDGINLYVTDQGNHKVRQISIATNVVTTLAGSGTSGSADGSATTASFSTVEGITTDGTNLYVVDGNKIRMVVIATGAVSTLSLVSATGGAVTLTGLGITTDSINLYVTDSTIGMGSIHKIVISTGVTTLLAGNPSAGMCQDIDGMGILASFCLPRGITTDGTNLYVAGNDSGYSKVVTKAAVVRKIVIATGQVTTLAGGGAQWDTNAIGTLAGFRNLYGITTDGVSLFAVDSDKIRRVQ